MGSIYQIKDNAAGFRLARPSKLKIQDAAGSHSDINVGGKLAQIGQRLIDTTANKLADDFFGKFNDILSTDKDESEDKIEENISNNKGISQISWISILIILTSISLLFWYSLS